MDTVFTDFLKTTALVCFLVIAAPAKEADIADDIFSVFREVQKLPNFYKATIYYQKTIERQNSLKRTASW